MSKEQLQMIVTTYVEHILKSVDMENSKDTRMFQAGVSEGINNMMIDCFISQYEEFKEATTNELAKHGYSRYGTSLDILEGRVSA